MTQVRLLTEQQAELLRGVQFRPDSFFKPVLDALGRYVITEQECTNCIAENYQWVKSLPLIEFKPIINTEIP